MAVFGHVRTTRGTGGPSSTLRLSGEAIEARRQAAELRAFGARSAFAFLREVVEDATRDDELRVKAAALLVASYDKAEVRAGAEALADAARESLRELSVRDIRYLLHHSGGAAARDVVDAEPVGAPAQP